MASIRSGFWKCSLPMNPEEHPTSNIQRGHRMAARILAHFDVRCSMLDVRCWMFLRVHGQGEARTVSRIFHALWCGIASWGLTSGFLARSLPVKLTLVGTSRGDVPTRESAGGIVAPLNAPRTAQRAVPTRFRGSMGELFRRNLGVVNGEPPTESFGSTHYFFGGSSPYRRIISSL